MQRRLRIRNRAAVALLLIPLGAGTYPLYDSEHTGIRRLEEARLAHEGVVSSRQRVAGELLRQGQVDLRLTGHRDMSLPEPDPAFSEQIASLLSDKREFYSVSVLDLSDLDHPRFGELQGDMPRNPGSVGKIVVATAVFQALADTYPDGLARREAVLHDTRVDADEFIVHDSHTVRLWNPETRTLTRRPLAIGNQGNLWEYLDWMMSASSNAAASMVMKQAMLLAHFGTAYPVTADTASRFFQDTPRQQLGQLAQNVFEHTLERNALDTAKLRQGSFFTKTGKSKVPGTNSYATSRELVRFLLRLEQGRIVDDFSSREIKRLLYVTERRIRYASSPALSGHAVYFKSGSFYQCEPEAGFSCKKYHGNKTNIMNSVAIVESLADKPRLFYLVALTSNVLRRNSAVDHQTFATRIHRLIERLHGHTQ